MYLRGIIDRLRSLAGKDTQQPAISPNSSEKLLLILRSIVIEMSSVGNFTFKYFKYISESVLSYVYLSEEEHSFVLSTFFLI